MSYREYLFSLKVTLILFILFKNVLVLFRITQFIWQLKQKFVFLINHAYNWQKYQKELYWEHASEF